MPRVSVIGPWIGLGLGILLVAAPKLILRSAGGDPLFGREDAWLIRMGRFCGVALMFIFGGMLVVANR